MAEYAKTRIFVFFLVILAAIVAVIVFVKGLIKPPDFTMPDDKQRFNKYLMCSYAMCIYGCNSNQVLDLFLDTKGCYDLCNVHGAGDGSPERRMCGSQYPIEFVWEIETIYYNNDNKSHWNGFRTERWIETDLLKNKKPNIRNYQDSDWCTSNQAVGTYDVTFGEYDYRECMHRVSKICFPFTDWCWVYGTHIEGLCEGTLRRGVVTAGDCNRATSGGLEPYRDNTGHIWLDPNLVGKCDSGTFVTPNYYSSCTFEADDVVYIWTEMDSFTRWDLGTIRCPEFILCNNLPS